MYVVYCLTDDTECIVECLETETHPNEDGNESEQNENESQSEKSSKSDSHFIARNKEVSMVTMVTKLYYILLSS